MLGRNLFYIADAYPREVWMSLLHNFEPKGLGSVTLPLFRRRISLSFCRKTTSPRLYFWTWTGFPLSGDVYYLRISRLVVNEFLFLLVNRSLRSTVLAEPVAFVHVCAMARGRVAVIVRYDERGNALCFYSNCSFWSKGHVSRFRLRFFGRLVQNWPPYFSLLL